MLSPPTKLIGLTGRAGAGKDTACRFLMESMPDLVERRAFADLLKVSAMRSLGIDPKHADDFKTRGRITVSFGANEPVAELTGREFYQRYGLEAHREVFGPSFWTDRVLEDLPKGKVIVITDVRLDDEAEAIHRLDGEVWHIERAGEPIAESGHATERGVHRDLIDRWVSNGSSLDEFRVEVQQEFLSCLL